METLGTYTLTYSASDGNGHTAIVQRTVAVLSTLRRVWNGPRVTFTKADYTDWTDPANQDPITPNVWLTRQDTRGLFNIRLEGDYTSYSSPFDAEWAYGTTANLATLTFRNWQDWNNGNPPSMVGRDAVLHLISEDIYLDLKFISWTSSGNGGGFAYERATAPFAFLTLQGDGSMAVLLHVSFTLTVHPVNDAPVNHLPPDQTVAEDSALVFAGNSAVPNAISVTDDAGAEEIDVVLSVEHGTLRLSGTTGLRVQSGADASPQMQLRGTVGAFNAALAGLTYRPDPNFNGLDRLTVETNDRGFTGSTGALADVDRVVIRVHPVIDGAPALANASTSYRTQTAGGLAISRNPADGPEAALPLLSHPAPSLNRQSSGAEPPSE